MKWPLTHLQIMSVNNMQLILMNMQLLIDTLLNCFSLFQHHQPRRQSALKWKIEKQ